MSIHALRAKIKEGIGAFEGKMLGLVACGFWAVALACTGVVVGLDQMRPEPRIVFGGSSVQSMQSGQGIGVEGMAGEASSSQSATNVAVNQAQTSNAIKGTYLASKSGAKYYPAWCKSANRIKEGNRVWFESEEEAVKAGYQKTSTC